YFWVVSLVLFRACPPAGLAADYNPCRKIKEIRVDKNPILSQRKAKKLTRKYLGLCAEPGALNLILRTLTNECVRRGYITSRAVIAPQDISSGAVDVHILEGRLEGFEFDENSRNSLSVFDKSQVLSAFAGFKNGILNLRDIEQGLSQMNRLSSKNITMKIYPGNDEGTSRILLTDHGGQSQVRVKTAADNSGQDSTGLYNVRMSVEQDDLLKLNDSWLVSYSQSAKKAESDKRSQSVYASAGIPFGYWNMSGNIVQSDYSTVIFGTNERIRNSGKGLHQNYRIERSLFRGRSQTASLWVQLNLKNTESFIEDVKSEVGSRKLTVIKCGLNHSFVSRLGYFNAQAAYHRGLDLLDAKGDEGPLTPFTPRAQFEKAEFSLNYMKAFQALGRSVRFKSFFEGQYAFAPLYSSEQIVIGDAYSVRGFKERSAYGDQGVYAANELTLALPGFLTENLGINTTIRETEWFAGFDAGLVKHFGGQEANFGQGKAFLTGWATGLRFNGKYLNGDVTYSQSVHTEDFIGISQEIYATLSLKLL
ncbi:MAG: hypothetical protein A3A86_03470, partial [Elusimicrobia bacterium RIFCSPLOWO2_01_FULL_60_11]